MGARQKLNNSYLTTNLAVAAGIGWLLQSWVAFVVTLAGMIVFQLKNGEIRSR